MLPIRDENPSGITPVVTYSLIGINFLVFFWQIAGSPGRFERIVLNYGFIPAILVSDPADGLLRMFTSMFLHGGWAHIMGNMLYLYIFGDNVEAALGRLRYLTFYLVSGIGASLTHLAFSWGSTVPAIGASGAISGVLAAYMIFYPEARIETVVLMGYIWQVVKVSALYYIGFWFVWQVIVGLISGGAGGVAYWAHVGGFVAGAVISRRYRWRARRRRRVEWLYDFYYY